MSIPSDAEVSIPMITCCASLRLVSGAIVPVPVGRMRNQFYPRRIAEYVTAAQLKPLKRSNASIERDFDFTTQRPKPESSKAQEVTKDEPLLGPPEVTAAPTPSLGLDLLSVRLNSLNPTWHSSWLIHGYVAATLDGTPRNPSPSPYRLLSQTATAATRTQEASAAFC